MYINSFSIVVILGFSVTIDFAYATVVSIQNIKAGDVLSEENIWVKRPGSGEILAEEFDGLIGKKVKRNIDADEHLKWRLSC